MTAGQPPAGGAVGASPMVARSVDGVSIAGTASVLEHDGLRWVDNADVDLVVTRNGGRPMRDEWLDRMGVSIRPWSAVPGEPPGNGAATTDELMIEAADRAIRAAGVERAEVDLFIAATTTPTRLTTSMGAIAAGALGMRCGAMEVRAGCASSVYAMAMAYGQLNLGARCVVVAAAETLTKVCPGTGPLPYLAGDAGAAVVLRREEGSESGMVGAWLCSDGTHAALAGAPGELPPTTDALARDQYRLAMDSRFDEAAADWWPAGPTALLAGTGISAGAVDAIVMNQANRDRLYSTARAVGLRDESVVEVVGETANSGATSLLVALDRALSADGGNRLPGIVLCSAVGGGLSAGAIVLRP